MMAGSNRFQYSAMITSDVSGHWGCRTFSYTGEWFQLEWPESCRRVRITAKELVLVVLGVTLWGSQWQGRNRRCRCDSAGVVAILNSGSSSNELAMHLTRNLFFFLASFSVSVFGENILGAKNGPADALSEGNPLSFNSQIWSAFRVQQRSRRNSCRLLC